MRLTQGQTEFEKAEQIWFCPWLQTCSLGAFFVATSFNHLGALLLYLFAGVVNLAALSFCVLYRGWRVSKPVFVLVSVLFAAGVASGLIYFKFFFNPLHP